MIAMGLDTYFIEIKKIVINFPHVQNFPSQFLIKKKVICIDISFFGKNMHTSLIKS